MMGNELYINHDTYRIREVVNRHHVKEHNGSWGQTSFIYIDPLHERLFAFLRQTQKYNGLKI